MVALKNGLPLILNDQGVAVAFDSAWLKAALDRAARKAGYESWWLLDEFSEAVSEYLRQDYRATTIELPRLEKVVRATLRDIGYREIAARFRVVNPFQSMSLIDCLGGSSEKKESTFFKRLAERIDTLHDARVRHFHFYDLKFFSLLLLGDDAVSWWGRPLMQARIVAFVRARVQSLSWPATLQCTIR